MGTRGRADFFHFRFRTITGFGATVAVVLASSLACDVEESGLFTGDLDTILSRSSRGDGRPEPDIAVDTIQDNPVEITLTAANSDSEDLTFEIIEPPLHGYLGQIDNNGLRTASVIYTPDPGFRGVDGYLFTSNIGAATPDPSLALITVHPQVVFSIEPDSGLAPLTVTGIASTMVGDPLPPGMYSWTFGAETTSGSAETHAVKSHVFSSPGTYTVTLSLAMVGLSSPVGCICIGDDGNPNVPSAFVAVNVAIAGGVLDQEGVGVGGVVVSANNDGPTVITGEDGSYQIQVTPGWGGVVTPQHVDYIFDPPNRYYASVQDDLFGQDFTATLIGGNNQPEVGSPISDVTVNEDAPDTVIDLSGVFVDPDAGGSLTLSVSANDNPALVIANVAGMTLSLEYQADQNGIANITIRAADSAGAFVEDTFQVTVNAVNDCPQIAEGDAVTFSVEEGSVANPLMLTATDVDSSSLTWSILIPPPDGVVDDGLPNPSGPGQAVTFSYTPNPGFTGLDSFPVQVVDSVGCPHGATVNVAVGGVNASGRVTRPIGGDSVVGVELVFEGIFPIPDLPSVTTDLSGEYSQMLPVGWNGTIRAADTDSFVLASTDDPGSDSRSYSIPVPPDPLPPPFEDQDFTGVRNYYVATTGSDSSNGAVDDEFATIQHAADIVLPGDSVFIREGIYDTSSYPAGGAEGTPTLRTVVDGTDTAPIRFEGIGPGLVTFDARAINRNCVSIETDYTIVSTVKLIGAKREGGTIFASWRTTGSPQPTTGPPDFTVTPTGRKVEGSKFLECLASSNSLEATGFAAGFEIRGQCIGCAVEYCMSFENGAGVGLAERDAVNTFRTYPLYQAPWPDAPLNCSIRGNLAFDNRKNDENSDGIGGRYITGCVFEDNIAFGNVDDNYDSIAAVTCTWAGNIAFDANPENTVDGDGNGMKVSTREGGGNTLRNNISFLNPRGGFDDDDGTDNRYYNNVAYRNNYGMIVESDVGPNALVNNLAYLNVIRDMTLSQDCPAAPPFAPNPSDYNYWGDGRPPFDPCNAGLPFDDANSLAFGANPNGSTAVGDPLFVNPIDDLNDLALGFLSNVQPGDIQAAVEAVQAQVRAAFALQTQTGGYAEDSPCVDAGVDVGIPFQRAAPDTGAIEMTP